MAMNPFLANLMQRIGPQMSRMPQIGQQWSGMRAPMQGLFGGRQFQPRRANLNAGMMPRVDPAQFMQALQGNPMFAPRTQTAPPMPSIPQGPQFTDYTGTPVAGPGMLSPQGVKYNSGGMYGPDGKINPYWQPER